MDANSRVKMIIGDLIMQVAYLQTENEGLRAAMDMPERGSVPREAAQVPTDVATGNAGGVAGDQTVGGSLGGPRDSGTRPEDASIFDTRSLQNQ